MDKDQFDTLIKQHRKVITHFQQDSGAYPASPNFHAYKYSWFRDGAFIADGLSRAGDIGSVERFFSWCAKIITDRRDYILAGGKLDARFTYEGKEAHEEWGNFQLDGYGTWLWAMQGHAARHGRSLEKYQEAAGLAQHYLKWHWQEECMDWWEERMGVHMATLACVYAGLEAYQHPEAPMVKAAISMTAERTDASLLICPLLGAVTDEAFAPMLKKIETELVSVSGGVHRYAEDSYYGGGEWPVLTSLLGWYYRQLGRSDEARAKLAWVAAQVGEHHWLPEQAQINLLHPETFDEWVAKAGPSASPLLWSHGMFLTLLSELKTGN